MRTVDLENITLLKGAHTPDSQFCVMELAAYLGEEPWSDHPKCVSPVIAAFLRSWNDSLDDNTRQELKPYALKSLNTVGTYAQEEQRAWMAIDWLVRECAPAFLRVAGLTEHAETLESLVALTGEREVIEAQPSIVAARDAAGAAAGDAAWDAAGAAAWDAAGAAARAAAGKTLQPTVKSLQASAFLLLNRMIDVTSSRET